MKQILIVEDDNLLNKTLAYNLASDDYAITNVLNARAAAEALKAKSFDLVLLDINLPDGNGYDLCRLIKPEHPDTVVIFLTANDQECDQIWGYEVGAMDYITKPFSIGALQRKVKAMFAMLEHHKPAKDIYDDGSLLTRLYGIMQENRRKVDEERKELQMLVSDISHQVKTPVSNLKMVTDTLLTKPVTEQEQTDFLQGIRSQTDKLDFLFQALVKASRLETGAIRLEKKDDSLFRTLAQAIFI